MNGKPSRVFGGNLCLKIIILKKNINNLKKVPEEKTTPKV
jgi:hypothetical protein